ncbi:MAG: tripartite tricarboxylate transporter permease [Candidatus Aenigmarchaeota archaeon]|nr:tripartite tricarboxylate transporter permease [Candidatus Aenigmarchaeota archaeon]
MIEILELAFLGVGAGVVAGLLPGIHPNTFTSLLLPVMTPLVATFTAPAVVVFIVTMAIANTFVSFLPAVFLGAPEGESALSVLPGHRLLLQGSGHEAVLLAVAGGVGVVLLSLATLWLLFPLLPFLYAQVQAYLSFLLLGVAVLMIAGERHRCAALVVFMLAGVLGLLSFRAPFASAFVLFPIFTGLFGTSTLLLSSKAAPPPQRHGPVRLPRGLLLAGVGKGFLSGVVVGVLPAVGPSQAGVLVHQATRSQGGREFLVSLGGITTVSTLFSLLSLYLINKPRSGAAIAVQQVIGAVGWEEMLLILAAAVFATGAGAGLTIGLSHRFAGLVTRVPYPKLSWAMIACLVALTVALTGWQGLLLLLTATAIGLLPPFWGVKRTHTMGVLMVPVILLSFGLA